jgi:hypothetical protein
MKWKDNMATVPLEKKDHEQHGKWNEASWTPLLLAWRTMALRQWEGMWESRAL